MNKHIDEIVRRWFVDEPALFIVLMTHNIVENNCQHCVFRVGEGRLEYNDELVDFEYAESPSFVDLLLRIEVYRILLGHPYTRKEDGCPNEVVVLGSNLVLSNYIDDLPIPRWIRDIISRNVNAQSQSYEWYIHWLKNILPSRIESTDSGNLLTNADLSDLWGEDTVRTEFIGKHINEIKDWGSVPSQMQQMVKIDRPIISQVDYKLYLRQFKRRVVSTEFRLTRMRPSRRYGWLQMGRHYEYKSKLLIAVDVSGSIAPQTREAFLQESRRIFNYGIGDVSLMPFDTDVQPVIPLSNRKKKIEISAYGGTKFQPIFDYVGRHPEYDGVIILTDGYAPHPKVRTEMFPSVLWICDNSSHYQEHKNWMQETGQVTCMEPLKN